MYARIDWKKLILGIDAVNIDKNYTVMDYENKKVYTEARDDCSV